MVSCLFFSQLFLFTNASNLRSILKFPDSVLEMIVLSADL